MIRDTDRSCSSTDSAGGASSARSAVTTGAASRRAARRRGPLSRSEGGSGGDDRWGTEGRDAEGMSGRVAGNARQGSRAARLRLDAPVPIG